ncbi:Proclotting enzyme [Orchesella cincta]|uniref:Proclotting enzyme n=1 Tax=Orchesella cincta TaxID=48709 RepID=A0A1D2MGL5_ORCCI|nr:Proclotting enzyme [Orchesella cincta]
MFATCVQLMPTHAQRIFGIDIDPDPFGLRRPSKEESSQDDYEPEDDDNDEPHTRPSLIPGIPLPDLSLFRSKGGSERGRGRGEHESRRNDRGRGRHKGRGKENGQANNTQAESEEEYPPRESRGKNDRQQRGRGPNTAVGPCGPDNRFCNGEDYIKELKLTWSPRVHNGTGIYLRDPNAPGGKRFVPVGIEQPNEKYATCETPNKQRGYCRHLEHCVLDEFRDNFIKFLEYRCDIPRQNFVGVCCPDTEPENEPRGPNNGGFPFLPPRREPGFQVPTQPFGPRSRTTTRRPQREPSSPNRPSQDNRNCGVNERITSRIVGGRIADPKAWPWMAALLKKSEAVDYRNGQYCGGVLISEFHVLTASHCVDGFDIHNLAVRIGEYDFARNNDSGPRPQDIDVADVFVHENYNRYSYKNDIAVIKLAKSAYFDKRIRSICLPSPDLSDEDLVNKPAIVTGFGTIYYGGPVSDKLMEITVPIWNLTECQAAYTQPVEPTNLCAGVRQGSRDSCQGDSGGPLQLQLRGRWTTVGVVSWGIRCAEPGYPGVYSKVSKFIGWIETQMRRN